MKRALVFEKKAKTFFSDSLARSKISAEQLSLDAMEEHSNDINDLLTLQLVATNDTEDDEEIIEMVEEYNNVDFDDELYYGHSPCPTKTISEIHNCLTSVENATSSTDIPIKEEIAARLCVHEHCHVIDLISIIYALHKFSRNQKMVYL